MSIRLRFFLLLFHDSHDYQDGLLCGNGSVERLFSQKQNSFFVGCSAVGPRCLSMTSEPRAHNGPLIKREYQEFSACLIWFLILFLGERNFLVRTSKKLFFLRRLFANIQVLSGRLDRTRNSSGNPLQAFCACLSVLISESKLFKQRAWVTLVKARFRTGKSIGQSD